MEALKQRISEAAKNMTESEIQEQVDSAMTIANAWNEQYEQTRHRNSYCADCYRQWAFNATTEAGFWAMARGIN